MSLGMACEIRCTCGKIIFELDAIFCHSCGDVACKDCYTDCLTCGKMYCHNCSQSPSQCLKCDLNRALKKNEEKAFLVLNSGVAKPIKNSQFMISKTSIPNARELSLTMDGKTYWYTYRSAIQNVDDKTKYDYFLYFEETSELQRKMREAYDGIGEYDDYSTLGWGL